MVVDKQNIFLLYDFFKNESKYIIKIYPCITNLLNLIDSKNIKIFIILKNELVEGLFFYRKTCTYINKKEIVCCFSSYKSSSLSSSIFVNKFKDSIRQIISSFHYLSIENISDNDVLIKDLQSNYSSIASSPYAYFFYNYAYQTLPPNKVLIIN